MRKREKSDKPEGSTSVYSALMVLETGAKRVVFGVDIKSEVMSLTPEQITYYALVEYDQPEATGLFRARSTAGGATYLERIDRGGEWVRDNDLQRYLTGRDSGAEKVSGRPSVAPWPGGWCSIHTGGLHACAQMMGMISPAMISAASVTPRPVLVGSSEQRTTDASPSSSGT